MDVSGWSLMAVTVGETRRCCCGGRVSSALGEGADRFSAAAGLGSGSCTVAVGCEAGVAVLLGRLKMSVAVGGDGIPNQQFVSWVYLYLITAAAENILISMGNTLSTCIFFESKTNRTSVQTDCTILVFSK